MDGFAKQPVCIAFCISMMTVAISGMEVPIVSRLIASWTVIRLFFMLCEIYFRKYKTSLILLLAWSTNAGAQDSLLL